MTPPPAHPRDPLHGVTLESILHHLVQHYGWGEMAQRIPVRCFQFNPSVKSSLTFLRQTPWARQRIEGWFLADQRQRPGPPNCPPRPSGATEWKGP